MKITRIFYKATVLIPVVLLLTACGEFIINAESNQQNPVNVGSEITISATCFNIDLRETDCGELSYLKYQESFYHYTSCNQDSHGNAVGTYKIIARQPQSNASVSCGGLFDSSTYQIVISPVSGYLNISPQEESIGIGSNTTLTILTSVATESQLTVEISPESSKVLFYPNGNKCTILSGSSSCDITITGESSGVESITATAVGYVSGSGKIGVYPTTPAIFYATNNGSGYDGALDGVAGADVKCNSDPSKPNNGSYKALIVGNSRVACTSPNCSSGGQNEHTNWVLRANTTYRYNGTIQPFATTTSNGIFNLATTPSNISLYEPAITNKFQFTRTGLYQDWTSGSTCSDWQSNSMSESGNSGLLYDPFSEPHVIYTNQVQYNAESAGFSTTSCDGSFFSDSLVAGLICVQQ